MLQRGIGTGLLWAAMGLAGLSLVLVVINAGLFLGNQSTQAEINQRQQFINQGIQLSRVNEALARSLAAAAVNNKDDQLRELLSQHGITVNVSTPAPAAPVEGK